MGGLKNFGSFQTKRTRFLVKMVKHVLPFFMPTKSCYLVLSGKVNVKTNSGDSSLLGPGDVFGLEELIQDELAPEGSSKFRVKVR